MIGVTSNQSHCPFYEAIGLGSQEQIKSVGITSVH